MTIIQRENIWKIKTTYNFEILKIDILCLQM